MKYIDIDCRTKDGYDSDYHVSVSKDSIILITNNSFDVCENIFDVVKKMSLMKLKVTDDELYMIMCVFMGKEKAE